MSWFNNAPSSIVTAWNNLCEALWERLEFYGINAAAYPGIVRLPPVPCRRKMDINTMRNAVRDLVLRSFDFRRSGTFSEYEAAKFRMDETLFDDFGVDMNAFYGSAETIPCYRHTQSEFIFNASKLLHEVVRYPLPVWDSPGGKSGFVWQCELRGEDNDGNSYYGNWLDDGILSIGMMQINVNMLVIRRKKYGRAKSYNHHWVYLPSSLKSDRPAWRMPQLRGSAPIRTKFTVAASNQAETIDCGTQEFTIDFSTNRAAGNIDFSAAENFISPIWDGSVRSDAYAVIEHTPVGLCLKEENFPESPFIYK